MCSGTGSCESSASSMTRFMYLECREGPTVTVPAWSLVELGAWLIEAQDAALDPQIRLLVQPDLHPTADSELTLSRPWPTCTRDRFCRYLKI